MNNSLDRDSSDDLTLVKKVSASLEEHFDTVQIFVTRHDSNHGTKNIAYGSGNWFARYGQVNQWVIEAKAEVYKEVNKPE